MFLNQRAAQIFSYFFNQIPTFYLKTLTFFPKLKSFSAKLKEFFSKLKVFLAKLKVSENPVTFIAAKWLKKQG